VDATRQNLRNDDSEGSFNHELNHEGNEDQNDQGFEEANNE